MISQKEISIFWEILTLSFPRSEPVNKEQFHCEPRWRVQTLCCCLQWLQLSRWMICLIYGHNFRCFSFVVHLNCLLAFLSCSIIMM